MVVLVCDAIGVGSGALFALVTNLCATSATARRFGRARRRRGWVRGGRLRGVARGLSNLGLKVFEQGLEFFELCALAVDDFEERVNCQADRLGGLCPVLRWDAQQVDRLLVHMREDAMQRRCCQPPDLLRKFMTLVTYDSYTEAVKQE